jgi:Cd2+/Zn2+-exporting ATPase
MKTSSIDLEIQGLCCNDEKVLLERKVSALDGVSSYDINVVLQKLRVDYDASRLSPQDIIKTIAETGLKAHAPHDKQERFAWWKERRIVLLIVSGLLTTAALSISAVGAPDALERTLFILAIVTGGFYPAKAGLSAARTFSMNINALLILGVVGAVGLDLWQEAAVLVFVYSLGNVLESYVVKKARGAIKSFLELSPKEALVKRNGTEAVVPADTLHVGDVVLVRPGEKIPIDGIVLGGESYVDESAVTGEPVPAHKTTGKTVFAGTMNQRGSLTVSVTHTAKDTTLAKIIHSIEQAQARKSRYQLFGERFSKVYTPVMFGAGVFVAMVPPILLGGDWHGWIYRALVVFVVSCSCGLALSVPVAIVAAVSNAARHGILLKGGLFLEAAAGVKVVAFDKTGTLTIGRPVVTKLITADGVAEDELLSLAASIEALSEHPLGRAIVRRAREAGVYNERTVTGFEAVAGKGVTATIDGLPFVLGNSKFLEEYGVSLAPLEPSLRALETEAQSAVILAAGGRALGVIGIADVVKHESRDAVAKLAQQGLDVVMLTGDAEGTAAAISRAAGIREYQAGLMPHEKTDRITSLRNERGSVMMVGDGINDSPAMAASDVGVAMGAAGTDVAWEAGDIVLLADDLSRVPWIIRLGRRTLSTIRQNVIVSLSVIAVLVPAALFGKIDLLSGLIINEGVAILVILNGLRLLR